MRLLVLLSLSITCAAGGAAHAQDVAPRADTTRADRATWALVGASTRRDPALLAMLRRIEGAMARRDNALASLENVVARPEAPVPAEALRALSTRTAEALEHAAFGRNGPALTTARAALSEARPFMPAIARDEAGMRDLSNACLIAVRALLQQRESTQAALEARECIRWVPDLDANPNMHPPQVRALLASTREALESPPHARLRVESASDDPAGCTVRVNGRRVGQTPLAELAVPSGEHFVQVECNAETRGRVRRVLIAADEHALVRASPLLELALSEGPLLLYPSEELLEGLWRRDATALARAAYAYAAVVVRPTPDGFSIVRITDDGRTTAADRAHLEADATDADVDAVLDALAHAAGRTSTHAMSSAPNASLESDANSGGPGVVGVSLGVLGVGGTIAAWVLTAEWASTSSDAASLEPRDTYAARVRARDSASDRVLVAGSAGLGLLTLALPLWLPEEDGIPAWAWISGGAGALTLGVGAYLTAQHESLGINGEAPTQGLPLGPLVMMHAAPLLGIPLTYAVRSLFRDDDASSSVAVAVRESEASLRIEGRF